MATQVTPGLWHVDCTTLDRPNVFLVDDGDRTLIDAGWPADEQTVRAGVHDAGYDLADIDRVLLTHADADHVGTLSRLTPALDAPTFVHHAEAPYLTGEALPPWTARHGVEALHRLYYRRLTLPDLPIHTLADEDTVGGFRVLHTPGHTPGHVAFVHEGLSAAFLGDLAYEVGGTLRVSGWLTSYDAEQVQANLRSLTARTGPLTHVCPGHGPIPDDGNRRLRALTGD